MKTAIRYYHTITYYLQLIGMPIILFAMRCWMARIFFYAGLTKISDWHSTLMLFRYEYHVPILPPNLAAVFATCTELTCPILLVLGFATRFATLPMLAMTLVIQFTYYYFAEHYYWMMLLTTILCYGAGTISLDAFLKRWMMSK